MYKRKKKEYLRNPVVAYDLLAARAVSSTAAHFPTGGPHNLQIIIKKVNTLPSIFSMNRKFAKIKCKTSILLRFSRFLYMNFNRKI